MPARSGWCRRSCWRAASWFSTSEYPRRIWQGHRAFYPSTTHCSNTHAHTTDTALSRADLQPVRNLLRAYEQRFLERLATGAVTNAADVAAQAKAAEQAGPAQVPRQRRQHGMDERALDSADFNRPVFAAAAFALLGKARKVNGWLAQCACLCSCSTRCHAAGHMAASLFTRGL